MRFTFAITCLLVFTSCLNCQRSTMQVTNTNLHIPNNKIWAHRVNDTITAQDKENKFEGMELDIIYSPYQNKVFVCHNESDTINNLTLDLWFSSLKKPEDHCYWLDVKNFNYYNAEAISRLIKGILQKHGIQDHAFIESSSVNALRKVKEQDLHASLWVDNFYWTKIDTTDWVNKVTQQIEELHPDAISCEYRMFEALTTFFPEQNIFSCGTHPPNSPMKTPNSPASSAGILR